MLFNPSSADVRQFFCETWRKHQTEVPLTPIEAMALDWIVEHPEYHAELADATDAQARDYAASTGRENPFLHLAMHLAIAEQLQIDQPPGIRSAFQTLAQKRGSLHDAAHQVMECLGETLWKAQRERTMPDGAAYLECVRRRTT